VQTWEERRFDVGQLQGEVWRMFVFAMLAFLIVEGILIMPAPRQARAPLRETPRPPKAEEQPA
jgi:hypothetical protein